MATVAQLDALGLRQTIREELDRSGLANLVRQLQADAVAVSALPAAALAGQEVYLQTAAMAALSPPVKWLLRYDGSKWAVEAGAPLFAEIDTGSLTGPDRSVTSTTYVALAVPLTLVVPVVGWYDIELGAGGFNTAATASQIAAMSYDIGATPAVDADAIAWQNAVPGTDVQRVWRSQRKQFTSAPVTLTAKFRAGSGTAVFRGPKSIKATPVLLG